MAAPTTAATPAAVTSPSTSHFWLLAAAAACAAGVIVCDVPLPSVDAVAVATLSPSEVSVAVSPSVRSGEEKNTVLTAQGASPSKSVFPSASCTVTALPDWMPSEETPPGCAMPP